MAQAACSTAKYCSCKKREEGSRAKEEKKEILSLRTEKFLPFVEEKPRIKRLI